MPTVVNGQDLNRYSYVRNNPINLTDPSGNEVCFVEGPRAGQCYEGADGEDSAMTREEEKATVTIMTNEGVDSNGLATSPEDVRFSEFGDVSGAQIVRSLRYTDSLGLDGPARNQAFIRQLVLDRCDCRIQVGDLTWEVVVRTGQNVAVGAAATAAVGVFCSTGVGCVIAVGAIAGGVANVGADEIADCVLGDCGSFSVSEGAANLIVGGINGATSGVVGADTAIKVGSNKLSTGLGGALWTAGKREGFAQAPAVVTAVVSTQVKLRGLEFGFDATFRQLAGGFG